MTDYTKLVEDLHDIEKTMFALGTSPINMDKISMYYAYNKRWGRTAKDAADAIEALQKRLVNALTALHLANEKMGYYGIQPYTEADGEDMISDWVKTLVHKELKQHLPKRGEDGGAG